MSIQALSDIVSQILGTPDLSKLKVTNNDSIHAHNKAIVSPIAIEIPMKHNHIEKRAVLIKPEWMEGKEEKVRFRYMSKEEVVE